MRWSHFLLLFAMLLLVLTPIDPPRATAQLFHTETILESDGLPNADIKSITQDGRGFIWVASRGGIAHYNGLAWEEANLDSITASSNDGLLETGSQGQVWALLSGNQPALISQGLHGWASHNLPGAMARKDQKFSHFALTTIDDHTVVAIAQEPNLLFISTADGWHQVPLKEHNVDVLNDLVVMDNQFILATSHGVFSIPAASPTTLKPLEDDTLSGPVLCLSVNQLDSSLWMVGDGWIGRYVQGAFAYLEPPQRDSSFTGFHPVSCQTDGYGGIYLSGIFSTEYFHPETGMDPQGPKNGWSEFGATDFFLDRELVLWQGTSAGIHKIISRYAKGYNQQQGLLTDEVTALLRRRDGTVVIGHNNGLTLWADQMTHLEFPQKDQRDRVLDMSEDSLGNVWIAGRQRGVGRLSADGSLRWWPLGQEPLINYISSVLVDDDDRIWITSGNRILIMQGGEFTEFPLLAQIKKGAYLRRLIKGRNGTIYVATGNRGVLTIKDGEVQQWTTGLSDQGDSVYDILEASNAVTWVATRNGLYLLADHRLKRPTAKYLHFNRPIYFVETDIRGRLWLGTDNGVIRVDGSQVEHLTSQSGVIGKETNRCASLLDPKGRFWVGTERGLTIFNDLFENTTPQAPLVHLVQLDSGEKSFPLHPGRENMTLSAQSTNLNFHFRVLTTTEPRALKIMHRLDGFDTDWVEQKNLDAHVIRYAGLSPGTYQFQIKAAASGQPWSPVACSPKILIIKPVWQSFWFLVLSGLAVLATLALLFVFFNQRRERP